MWLKWGDKKLQFKRLKVDNPRFPTHLEVTSGSLRLRIVRAPAVMDSRKRFWAWMFIDGKNQLGIFGKATTEQLALNRVYAEATKLFKKLGEHVNYDVED